MKITLSKIFFIVSTFIVLVTHIISLLFMTETNTGFFKPEYASFRIVFGVLAFVLCCGLFFLGKNKPQDIKTPVEFSRPLSIISILTAIGFLFGNAVSSLGQLTTSSLIKMAMALIVTIFFLVFGLCGIFKLNPPKFLTVLTLPYFVYNLILVFARNSGMSVISENAYEIILLCAVLLFFSYMAKFICGVEREKNLSALVPVGYIAALFSFTCTVSRYIIILIGKGNVLKVNAYPDFSTFALGVFITAFCFSVLKPNSDHTPRSSKNTVEKELNEQPGEMAPQREEEQQAENIESKKPTSPQVEETKKRNFDKPLTDNDFFIPGE